MKFILLTGLIYIAINKMNLYPLVFIYSSYSGF